MRHEKALERLDELDAGQGYGLALRLHLATCRSCAAAARGMEAALKAYRGSSRPEEGRAGPGNLIEERVMAAVRLMPPPRQDFAIRDWVLPGAVIVVSMFLLPIIGRDSGFMERLLGSGYEFYLFMVLGIAFTLYSAFFIATHLTELRSYLERRGLGPR